MVEPFLLFGCLSEQEYDDIPTSNMPNQLHGFNSDIQTGDQAKLLIRLFPSLAKKHLLRPIYKDLGLCSHQPILHFIRNVMHLQHFLLRPDLHERYAKFYPNYWFEVFVLEVLNQILINSSARVTTRYSTKMEKQKKDAINYFKLNQKHSYSLFNHSLSLMMCGTSS